jgi:hypothetical protein
VTCKDGKLANVSGLATPIVILMELPPSVYNNSKRRLSEGLDPERGCLKVDGIPPGKKVEISQCSFWDEKSEPPEWSTRGCKTGGIFKYIGKTYIECACDHLTEFAILAYETAVGSCNDTRNSFFGNVLFLILGIVYGTVFLTSMSQLRFIIKHTKFTKYLLVACHSLLGFMSLFRAVTMVFYYAFHEYVSDVTLTIISGLPTLAISWLYSSIVFAWVVVLLNGAGVDENKHKKLRWPKIIFVATNSGVTIVLVTAFIALAAIQDNEVKDGMAIAGTTFMAGVNITGTVLFLVWGLRLVRMLTKDFPSMVAERLRRKVIVFAVGFSLLCSVQLTVNFIDQGSTAFIVFIAIYYVVDICCQCMVLITFWKGVKLLAKKRKKWTPKNPHLKKIWLFFSSIVSFIETKISSIVKFIEKKINGSRKSDRKKGQKSGQKSGQESGQESGWLSRKLGWLFRRINKGPKKTPTNQGTNPVSAKASGAKPAVDDGHDLHSRRIPASHGAPLSVAASQLAPPGQVVIDIDCDADGGGSGGLVTGRDTVPRTSIDVTATRAMSRPERVGMQSNLTAAKGKIRSVNLSSFCVY